MPPFQSHYSYQHSNNKRRKHGVTAIGYPFKRKKVDVVIDNYRETQPLPEKESRELRQLIFKRMIESETQMNHPIQRRNLFKTLVFLVARLYCDVTPEMEEQLLEFALKNPKARGDMIILWLAELYDQSKGFSCCIKNSEDTCVFTEDENTVRYDAIMLNALNRLFDQNFHNDTLFHRIFLEAPMINPEALLILRNTCADPESSAYSMITLRELVLTRNRQRYDFIKVLLELSYVEDDVVRQEAIETTKELSNIEYVYPEIRESIIQMCQRISESYVPDVIWSTTGSTIVKEEVEDENVLWNETYAKAALVLPLNMGSMDKTLLPEVTKACKKAPNSLKKFLLNFIVEVTSKF